MPSLDAALARLAAYPPHPEPPELRHDRGILWALAQGWAVRRPDSPATLAAVEHLAAAMDLACEAYGG